MLHLFIQSLFYHFIFFYLGLLLKTGNVSLYIQNNIIIYCKFLNISWYSYKKSLSWYFFLNRILFCLSYEGIMFLWYQRDIQLLTNIYLMLATIDGEGNGTPLQYSCLENPWTQEPGRLQSMGSLKVGHNWVTSFSLSCIGEGNGNPFQCSCPKNPRDRGA